MTDLATGAALPCAGAGSSSNLISARLHDCRPDQGNGWWGELPIGDALEARLLLEVDGRQHRLTARCGPEPLPRKPAMGRHRDAEQERAGLM